MDRKLPLGRRRRPATRWRTRVARPTSYRAVLCRTVLGRAVLGLALAVPLAVPLVTAGAVTDGVAADREDALDRRRSGIVLGIDAQQADVVHSSRRLQAATAAWRSSRQQLSAARATLAATTGQLAAARMLDSQQQLRLAAAEQRLAAAEADFEQARSLVEETREGIERFAAQSLSSSTPGLITVSAMVNGDTALPFPELMSSAESVLSAQTASMDDLDAAQILMRLREDRVLRLRDQVALERAAAADQLARTAGLVRTARARRQQVRTLTLQHRDSRQAAASARRDDLQVLRGMRRERVRVRELLSDVRLRKASLPETSLSEASPPGVSPSGVGLPGVSPPEATAQRRRGGTDPVARLAAPVPGAYVSSPFGRRLHPILRVVKLHDGTDYGASCGTPVRAAAGGEVVSRSHDAGFGNRVIIAHGTLDGTPLATSYNHLSRAVASPGQRVSPGDVVGYVGSTGLSTGCHLHFMVYERGVPTDPAGWL